MDLFSNTGLLLIFFGVTKLELISQNNNEKLEIPPNNKLSPL